MAKKVTRKLRPIEVKDCKIKFEAEDEHISVRGNAMVTEDKVADKACEDAILARLNDGDISAWFCAHVTVTFGPLSADDYLGACSYDSLEDFTKEKGGYYTDMIDKCVDTLNAQLNELIEKLR